MNEWFGMNKLGFRPLLCTWWYRLNWDKKTCGLRDCPPDTGFENGALFAYDRLLYRSVTEAPHNMYKQFYTLALYINVLYLCIYFIAYAINSVWIYCDDKLYFDLIEILADSIPSNANMPPVNTTNKQINGFDIKWPAHYRFIHNQWVVFNIDVNKYGDLSIWNNTIAAKNVNHILLITGCN